MSGYVTTTIYGFTWSGLVLPKGSPPLGSELVTGAAGAPYAGTNLLRLVQYNPAGAGGNLPVGGACKYVGVDIVDGTSAVTDTCDGVNDISPVALPVGSYFWMNRHGFCKPLVAAGIAAGVNPGCTVTFATLGAAAAGLNKNIKLLAASGAGGQTSTFQN